MTSLDRLFLVSFAAGAGWHIWQRIFWQFPANWQAKDMSFLEQDDTEDDEEFEARKARKVWYAKQREVSELWVE